MSSMENLKAIKAMELLQNNSNRSIIIPAEKFVLDTSLNLYKTTVTHNMETVNIDASVYYDNGSCACSVKVIDKNSFTLYTTEKKECRVVIFANWNAKPVYQYNSLASFTTDDLMSTTNKRYVNDNQLEIINNMSDKNLDKLGDLSTLDKTVVETIEELFQSGSNGKKILASAITAKGIATSETDSFETMASNIAKIINTDEGSELLLDVDGRYIDEVATFNNKRTSDLVLSTSEKITTQTPDGKSYVMKFVIENQEDKDDFRYKSKEHEIKTLLPFEPGDKIMKDVDDGVYKLFKKPIKYNSWLTFLENEPGYISVQGNLTQNNYRPNTPSSLIKNGECIYIPTRNPSEPTQIKIYNIKDNSWSTEYYKNEYTVNCNSTNCEYDNVIYSFGGINTEINDVTPTCYAMDTDTMDTSDNTIIRNKISNIPDSMLSVYDATACRYNANIYLIGGKTNSSNIKENTKQVLIYNISNDSWTKGVELPEILLNPKSFIYRDEMYVVGRGTNHLFETLIYKFDFVFKKWMVVNNETIPGQQIYDIVLDNDNLILFYSYNRQVGVSIYNIKKNKWSLGTFLVDDKIISTSSIYSCDTHIYNNKVYLMNIITVDMERRIFCYDIDSDTWENNTVVIPKTITNVTPYYDKISDTLFVLGGIDNKEDGTTQALETVYKHNYRTGESTIIGALPKKLYDYSITRFGDNLYLFGGYTEKTSDNPNGINKDVIVYSLTKGAVEKVCANVIPGYAFNIKAVNRGSANKCFLFNVGTTSSDTTASVYLFDYNSETISLHSQITYKPSEMSVFWYNNFLYVYDGGSSVSKCDLNANTWTEIVFSDTIVSKEVRMVEKFNDSLYFIGGIGKTTNKPINNVYTLDLVTEAWSQITNTPEVMYTGVTCFVDNYLTIYGYTSDYPDGKPKNKVQEYIFKPIDKWDFAFGNNVIYHSQYNSFLYKNKLHFIDNSHYIYNILTSTTTNNNTKEDKTPQSSYLYYNDYIYKFGNHKCEKNIARFNLTTEAWENSFGQLPVYFNLCASCIDKNTGNCFLISGTESTLNIDTSNTITDLNDVKSKMSMNITKYTITGNKSTTGVIICNGEPVELVCSKSIFHDNKIYLFGGINKLGEVSNKIYVINPDTFECILLDTVMPVPRWAFNIEIIDNKAYIFNGKSSLDADNVSDTIDVIDLDLNIFGIGSVNPFPRVFSGSVTTSNKILVSYGRGKNNSIYTRTLLYEPSGYIGTLTETFDDDINFPTFKHRTIITSSNSDALHIKCKIPIEVI